MMLLSINKWYILYLIYVEYSFLDTFNQLRLNKTLDNLFSQVESLSSRCTANAKYFLSNE